MPPLPRASRTIRASVRSSCRRCGPTLSGGASRGSAAKASLTTALIASSVPVRSGIFRQPGGRTTEYPVAAVTGGRSDCDCGRDGFISPDGAGGVDGGDQGRYDRGGPRHGGCLHVPALTGVGSDCACGREGFISPDGVVGGAGGDRVRSDRGGHSSGGGLLQPI